MRDRIARRPGRSAPGGRQGLRPKDDRVAHGLPSLAAAFGRQRFEPERAEERRLAARRRRGCGRSRRPRGRAAAATLFRTSAEKATRTGTRWTTLVKLPVALSGGSSENSSPRRARSTPPTPSIVLPSSASIGDVDLLAGLDVGELGLLEIGVDIGRVERHQRHQPGSRLDELADLGRLVADDAVERGDHAGEREVALGLWPSAVTSSAAGADRLVALRLEHVEIGSRAFLRRDGGRRRRPGWRRASAAVRSRSAVACSRRCCEPKFCLGELQRAVVFELARARRRPERRAAAPAPPRPAPRLGRSARPGPRSGGRSGRSSRPAWRSSLSPRRPRSDSRRRRSGRADRPRGRPDCRPPGRRSRWPVALAAMIAVEAPT